VTKHFFGHIVIFEKADLPVLMTAVGIAVIKGEQAMELFDECTRVFNEEGKLVYLLVESGQVNCSHGFILL
jgi:hypothetical protein